MTRFRPVCELCGRRTLCDVCSGKTATVTTTIAKAFTHTRTLVHTVIGTPSQVSAEWQRLAKEEEHPS